MKNDTGDSNVKQTKNVTGDSNENVSGDSNENITGDSNEKHHW